MSKLLDKPVTYEQMRLACEIMDDCFNATTGGTFTHLVADSGSSIAVADSAGGVLTFTTGATDNNECTRYTTEKPFLVAANLPLLFDARLSYTENATNKANIFVGFSSAFAANLMVDDGAGPATNMSAAGFFKIDSAGTGEPMWHVIVSLATTQTLVALTAANSLDKTLHTSGGGTYQNLRVEIRPTSSTTAEVSFFIDNVQVYKIAEWTYTSIAQMGAGTYLKAGGAGGEVLSLDYLYCSQQRLSAS